MQGRARNRCQIADMKNQIILLGALIACGGLLAYAQMIQKAHRLLSPDQLYALTTRVRVPWWKLLIPAFPVLIAYELLPFFPGRQAFVAVPALLFSIVLEFVFFRSVAKRTKDIELPMAFISARRKATIVMAFGMIAGIALCWMGMGVVHMGRTAG